MQTGGARVSVIIPNYNHARFLRQRIDTVLSQTYGDFELLIMDDASTDDSVSLIREYAGNGRVSIKLSEKNSGNPYLQWKAGLAQTTGEFVWIAESDDFCEINFLERLVPLLEANPRVGIATCDSWIVDSDGEVLSRYSDQWRQRDVFADYDLSDFDKTLMLNGIDYCRRYMNPWNTIPNASAAIFRRKAMEAIDGPVTTMRLCGDWYTYCKILMLADFVRIPDPLNFFRHHAVSVRTQTRTLDFLRETSEVHQFLVDALKLPRGQRTSRRVREFYAQALIAGQRRGFDKKVPIHRVPKVFVDALEFGAATAFSTLRILAREEAAKLYHRVRY